MVISDISPREFQNRLLDATVLYRRAVSQTTKAHRPFGVLHDARAFEAAHIAMTKSGLPTLASISTAIRLLGGTMKSRRDDAPHQHAVASNAYQEALFGR